MRKAVIFVGPVGRVGLVGQGFYALAAMPCAHGRLISLTRHEQYPMRKAVIFVGPVGRVGLVGQGFYALAAVPRATI